jgi:hypothetical protein
MDHFVPRDTRATKRLWLGTGANVQNQGLGLKTVAMPANAKPSLEVLHQHTASLAL